MVILSACRGYWMVGDASMRSLSLALKSGKSHVLPDFKSGLQKEQPIPAGAPVDFVPRSAEEIRLEGITENFEMI